MSTRLGQWPTFFLPHIEDVVHHEVSYLLCSAMARILISWPKEEVYPAGGPVNPDKVKKARALMKAAEVSGRKETDTVCIHRGTTPIGQAHLPTLPR